MKIFLFTVKIDFTNSGGSVIDLHLKAKGLASAGYDTTVVTIGSDLNSFDKAMPYQIIEENLRARTFFRQQIEFFQLLKKYEDQADVYYLEGHSYIMAAMAYKLLKGRLPVIAFFNYRFSSLQAGLSLAGSGRIFKIIRNRLKFALEYSTGYLFSSRIDRYIFNTPFLAEIYFKCGFPRQKSFIIEDYADTESIISSNDFLSKEQRDKIKIFCSGRMLVEKGFDIVIKAISKLENKEKIELTLGGDGPEKEYLMNLSKELGVSNQVRFPGWVAKEDLYRSFKESDIFIFPKWWIEYGSVVLTEAMAFGLASIIPAGGALEWLSGGGALTYGHDDPVELSQKIGLLVENTELRKSLGEKAIIKAKELSYENLTNKFVKLLETLKSKP